MGYVLCFWESIAVVAATAINHVKSLSVVLTMVKLNIVMNALIIRVKNMNALMNTIHLSHTGVKNQI